VRRQLDEMRIQDVRAVVAPHIPEGCVVGLLEVHEQATRSTTPA